MKTFIKLHKTLFYFFRSGADSVKVAPLLDPFWGPVIDGVMLKDHLIHLVRDGHVRPNTPISINYSKGQHLMFESSYICQLDKT